MGRIDFFGLAALYVISFSLASCSKNPEPPAPKDDQPTPVVVVDDKKPDKIPPPVVDNPEKPGDTTAAGLSKQEKYDAALLEALNLVADRKYADALLKMAEAKGIDDTEQIRQEIDKLKQRIDQAAGAERTAQDIQTVLKDGKAEDAGRLATAGLQQYGGDNAEQLAKLKRQAEALTSVGTDDKAARKKALVAEGDGAVKDKNLRAAAIIYEQALQLGDDDNFKKQCDDLRGALARYDDNRQKAAELRRDPANLEDAIAALNEAQKAWDTLEVRRDLDDYNLALQKRRDRLSVADFEVRGDVGIPAAGKAMAEELLPAFKARYDLVERTQLGKIIEELKLDASDLAGNDQGRQEVGRLAKVRYLVLGSITPIGGLTVNARLVDVRSGLVVQTAKVVAPTPEKLMLRLADLAAMLQMGDKEKLDYEQQLAKQGGDDIKAVDPKADLPDAPEVLARDQAPPAPLVPFAQRPPDFGGVEAADFKNLPPPPAAGPPALPVVVVAEELPIRERIVRVAIELGDNAFRRGRFREAHFHFNLALNLFPERREIRLRMDRVQICLPPNQIPGGIGDPLLPPPPVWPRLAVMNFIVYADPDVVSPAMSPWLADNLAPYFSPPFEVVDRNYVFWYMRRVGMTYRELLTNPYARRWLGRALNLRYFVFGTVRQVDDSIEIATYMMDAEYGFVRGMGVVRVGLGVGVEGKLGLDNGIQVASRDLGPVAMNRLVGVIDPFELRLRLSQLARQTLLGPEERVVYVRRAQSVQELVLKARLHTRKGDFTLAFGVYKEALDLQPDNVEVQFLYQQARRQGEINAFEAGRRKQFQQDQLLFGAARDQQLALAREAEGLRVLAAQQAAALSDANRRAREAERDAAYNRLIAQALLAQKQNNFNVSVQVFESAVALKPNDDGFRQLGLARAKAEEAVRANAAEARTERDRVLGLQREKELVLAREQVDRERKKRDAAEKARKENDDDAYKRLLDTAQAATAKDNFDEAVNALQTAKQLRSTDEVNRLLSDALIGQAKATAAKKGGDEKAKLEKQLGEEKQKREAADAEAKKNGELYNQALKLAQDAMAQRKYAVAATKFQEAAKVYKTDAVLTGLHAAQDAQAKEQKEADAVLAKQVAEKKRAEDLKRFLDQGQKALDGKKYDDAIQAFTQAKNLAPTDADVLAGLSKARQAREDALAAAKKTDTNAEKAAKLKAALDQGRSALLKKDFSAAGKALDTATQLDPANAEVLKFKADLQSARDSASADADTKKKKQAEFDGLIKTGRDAMVAKKYDDAVKAFKDAGKIFPDDKTWQDNLRQAEKGAADAKAIADKQREEEKLREQIKTLVSEARAEIKAGKFDAAGKALADAKKLDPKNADVIQASKDLEDARSQAANEDLKKKKEADYQKALKAGRDALAVKKYDDAIKAFNDAGKLLPDDKAWKDLVKLAEDAKKKKGQEEELQQLVSAAEADIKAGKLEAAAKAIADAKKIDPKDPGVVKASHDLETALATAKNDAEKKQRQADYEKAIKAGRDALAAKKYTEAIKAFTDAGKVMPGDKDAAALLKQAQQAQADAQGAADAEAKKKKDEEKRSADFAKLMDQGQTQMTAKKYADAVSTYNDALKLKPGDAKASAALKNAEFQQHMAEGQRLLNAKKFTDATSEFQEALKLFPDDANAKALLKKAKDGK